MITIDWGQILQNLGIFALIVGALSWTVKKLGVFYLQRQFAAYEEELRLKSQEYQSQLDRTLESHRSQLNLLFLKSSKLHERRIEILGQLHEKIVALNRDMVTMTMFMKPIIEDSKKEEQARIEVAGNSYNEFQTFYSNNSIFFSDSLCKLLDTLRDKYFDSYMDYTFAHRFGSTDFKFNWENAKKARDTVEKQIPGILAEIKTEFRKLLIVAEEST